MDQDEIRKRKEYAERRVKERHAALRKEADERRKTVFEHRERVQTQLRREQELLQKRMQQLNEDEERKKATLAKQHEATSRIASLNKSPKSFAFGSSTPRTLTYLDSLPKSEQLYDKKLKPLENGRGASPIATSPQTRSGRPSLTPQRAPPAAHRPAPTMTSMTSSLYVTSSAPSSRGSKSLFAAKPALPNTKKVATITPSSMMTQSVYTPSRPKPQPMTRTNVRATPNSRGTTPPTQTSALKKPPMPMQRKEIQKKASAPAPVAEAQKKAKVAAEKKVEPMVQQQQHHMETLVSVEETEVVPEKKVEVSEVIAPETQVALAPEVQKTEEAVESVAAVPEVQQEVPEVVALEAVAPVAEHVEEAVVAAPEVLEAPAAAAPKVPEEPEVHTEVVEAVEAVVVAAPEVDVPEFAAPEISAEPIQEAPQVSAPEVPAEHVQEAPEAVAPEAPEVVASDVQDHVVEPVTVAPEVVAPQTGEAPETVASEAPEAPEVQAEAVEIPKILVPDDHHQNIQEEDTHDHVTTPTSLADELIDFGENPKEEVKELVYPMVSEEESRSSEAEADSSNDLVDVFGNDFITHNQPPTAPQNHHRNVDFDEDADSGKASPTSSETSSMTDEKRARDEEEDDEDRVITPRVIRPLPVVKSMEDIEKKEREAKEAEERRARLQEILAKSRGMAMPTSVSLPGSVMLERGGVVESTPISPPIPPTLPKSSLAAAAGTISPPTPSATTVVNSGTETTTTTNVAESVKEESSNDSNGNNATSNGGSTNDLLARLAAKSNLPSLQKLLQRKQGSNPSLQTTESTGGEIYQ